MPEVKIYSTPSCAYCRFAKRFFEQNKVKYTEYNVAQDYEKAEEMVRISGQRGVPVIEIGGKVIIGFDQGAVKVALGIK
ncbi:Regulatory protein Spx [uncultured archaeon]|nr:Regulatory protein Spx [uncultured archaeon]